MGPNGRPLSAKDLQAPPVAEYNLMAFRLVLSVDEVRWEKLLLEFCNSPLPLEVREVRINISDDKDAQDRGMSRRPMAMRSGEGDFRRSIAFKGNLLRDALVMSMGCYGRESDRDSVKRARCPRGQVKWGVAPTPPIAARLARFSRGEVNRKRGMKMLRK